MHSAFLAVELLITYLIADIEGISLRYSIMILSCSFFTCFKLSVLVAKYSALSFRSSFVSIRSSQVSSVMISSSSSI